MKHLTQLLSVGLLLVLVAGTAVNEAEAQNRLYASVNGDKGTSNDCMNPSNPCTVARAVEVGKAADSVAVLVDSRGAAVEIDVGDQLVITYDLKIGAYMNNSSPTVNVPATLMLTGDLIDIKAGAQVNADADLALVLLPKQVMIGGNDVAAEANIKGSVTIGGSGYRVEVDQPDNASDCMVFDDLTIGGRVELAPDDDCDPDGPLVHIRNSLTVNERLQLRNSAVLRVSAAKGASGFVRINDRVFGGGAKLELSVSGYAEPDFTKAKPYDKKTCYSVAGNGSLEIDIDVVAAQYICISVPVIGGGDESTIYAGTVAFTGAVAHDGIIVSKGAARTEFRGGLTISDNLVVDAKLISSTGLKELNPVRATDWDDNDNDIVDSTEVADAVGAFAYLDNPLVLADSLAACGPANRPGVHLYRSSTFQEGLVVKNIPAQEIAEYTPHKPAVPDNKDTEDVDESEDEVDEKGIIAVPCQTGVFFHGSGSSVVEGRFEGDNDLFSVPTLGYEEMGGYVWLGSTSSSAHNLTLMGDLDVAGSMSRFEMNNPAKAPNVDGCTGAGVLASGNKFNKVVFGGGEDQQLQFDSRLGHTLNIPAISINKSGGARLEVFDGDAGFTANYMEVIEGTLLTGTIQRGALFSFAGVDLALVLNQSGGLTSEHKDFYSGTGPIAVYYGGGMAHNIGGEIPASINSLTIASGGNVNLEGKLTTNTLNMYAGTLSLGAKGDLVVVGEVTVGNTGNIEVGSGKFTPGIQLEFVGNASRSAGGFWPAEATMADAAAAAKDEKRKISIKSACKGALKVALNAGYTPLGGSLLIEDGTLDLNGNSLVANPRVPTGGIQQVGDDAFLCDSMNAPVCSASSAAGREIELADAFAKALERVHEEDTPWNRTALEDARSALNSARQAKAADSDNGIYLGRVPEKTTDKPVVVIQVDGRKEGSDVRVGMIPKVVIVGGSVHFRGKAGADGDRMDVLWIAQKSITGGTVTVDSTLDKLHVHGDLMIESGSLSFADSTESESKHETQLGFVYGNHRQMGGKVDVKGHDYTVMGNFEQAMADSTGSTMLVDSLGVASTLATTATFDLGGGTHTVNGDFLVAMDGDNAPNSYLLDNGELVVMGDVHFEGTGDVSDGEPEMQGLTGDVTFMVPSGEMQSVWVLDSDDAQLDDVMLSSGGVMQKSNVTQKGNLVLQTGIIHNSGDLFWQSLNTSLEKDLVGRLSVPEMDAEGKAEEAAIFLGSRYSFVAGAVKRKVSVGNAGGGVVTGGYILPTGAMAPEDGRRDFYRPVILQFGADLIPPMDVMASTYSNPDSVMMEWPEDGISVPAAGGGAFNLDTYANLFWKINFEVVPPQDPNLRVAADGLAGINNILGLRIVQWDCDGTNPRLAGDFDTAGDPIDDETFSANGRISGIPSLTQEGVPVELCNIFGIAANYLENPIGIAPPDPPPMIPTATLQLIHNVVGAVVDVYVDDLRVADDFAFQSATALSHKVAEGAHKVHIVAANAPDNSVPLYTMDVNLTADENYTVIASGNVTNVKLNVIKGARTESAAEAKAEFRLVHGAAGLGDVDIRPLEQAENTPTGVLWANNFTFGTYTGYKSVNPGTHHIEVTTAAQDRQIDVFLMDLGDYIDEALVLALSGAGASSSEGLTIMGVTTSGEVFFPQVITAAESGEELPTEFALQGNYPNPFNPSTRIQFDLPKTAEVTVQVIDMLGRNVMTVPVQKIEAGAKRTIELNAASLASGPYLYRLIAKSVSGVEVETGRMVLIK